MILSDLHIGKNVVNVINVTSYTEKKVRYVANFHAKCVIKIAVKCVLFCFWLFVFCCLLYFQCSIHLRQTKTKFFVNKKKKKCNFLQIMSY